MALQNAHVRDPPEARAEGDAGGPARRAAGGARAAAVGAAHRMLRRRRTRWARRAVASCVIFDRLAMQTSEYRRFNVTPAQAGDDYAAMREALTRRCARIVAGEYPAPDLLVIDGGKGQVARRRRRAGGAGHARRAADRHRQRARAQGRARRTSCFPDRDAVLQPAVRSSRAASAAADSRRGASLRDPGPSRAARQGAHRRRRCRRSRGIGATRRQALLAHFGGLKGVQAASVDDLARVPGISAARSPSESSPSCTEVDAARRRGRTRRIAASRASRAPRRRCLSNIPIALTWLRIVHDPGLRRASTTCPTPG